ncbi:hypothetical protein COCC4DRAFT_35084 [Bipolaris maydis ATCC 48331]|uniref:Uncharacterized protein n=2 Tax=Cochliobolus heterostrophus TaxID=5016 RepID=M2TEK0_COCH5|nr:uncharacterized protein COCC4DRAFT_35084 [Bipolaris maydis ATCC 48331]EMD84949.1 hypothetical protein COCHEDRAFT_1024743 [Bipolaris maydis C5]KAJ5025754.1 hypothetical protein J3E73DRAFT_432552 [Bipolaris maydis]ENH98875.1 hypothetical protein COCC4DRAFT_35084 [Bipolaris maydis ATCC 48331]KAJ5041408.1 hypothetical protein J3E74DRAFT_395283 [Bipolaris maydis]KAJ5064369.1 hypothetical protein J3E74DRAFT_311851 [Bipolaris maydis]
MTMASALVLLAYSCFIAVCAAFTHAVDDITPSYTVHKTTAPPTLHNTTAPPTSTKPCTKTTSEYYMPSYSPVVISVTETAVLTVLMHVTPFPNGTTATRFETVGDKAMTTSDEAMMALPTNESPTDGFTASASTTEDQYRVSNSSTTYTKYSTPYSTFTKPNPVPSLTTESCSFTTTFTITLHPYIPPTSEIVTATAITVSTLFDYDYLTPHTPIVNPTPTATPNPGLDSPPGPSKTGPPFKPGPTSKTPPGTTQDSPAQPGPSPANPPAHPQESTKGLPEVNPVDPTFSKVVVRPPITGAPGPKPTNDATHPPIVTLPGAGPIVIDPSRSEIVISGTTNRFNPGQQTTINNVPISFDSSAGFVVVGGTRTIGLPPMTPAPIAAPVVIGGTTVDIDDLVPGLQPGQITTIGTNTISLDESSSFLIVDGTRSIPLNQETSIPSTSTLDVNGVPIPVGQLATELDVGETTVIGSITVSRDDVGLVVGTTTIPLPTKTDEIVVGGTTISPDALPSGFSFIPTASGGGLLLPNGNTLLPGGETTIDGMEVSLLPGETPVAVIEDSISITATETPESTTASSSCSGLTCGQPTRTLTSPTGDNTAASSADVLLSGKWSDFVFASMFVGVFIHWA